MPKKACCCNVRQSESFCCNPIFFTDFITLFGDSMSDHAEVSPYDWIGLVVPRYGTAAKDIRRSQVAPSSCNCCCNCPPGTIQSEEDNQQASFIVSSGIKQTLVNTISKLGPNARWTTLNKTKTLGFGSRSDQYNQAPKNEGASYAFFRSTSTPQVDPDPTPIDYERGCEGVPCNWDAIAWCSGIVDGSDERHRTCQRMCCKGDRYSRVMPGGQDIYFAYKYSGCNLIWYPREFSFDHDPYVSQCNGFLTQRPNLDENGAPVGGFYENQNSCSPWANQRRYAGAAFNNSIDQCYLEYFPERQNNLNYPCACVPFPHIHGGVRDSVFNRVNVRITTGQMGYVAKMNPFSAPMLSKEEAGCCWCASAADQGGQWNPAFKSNRNSCFKSTYPFYDQKGKQVSQTMSCSPGINCYFFPGGDPQGSWSVARNPYYTRSCYEWGISPYLLRVAKTDHKMAYEIWRHGRNGDYLHDFGPYYQGVRADPLTTQKDFEISFKKISGKKSNLKQQYIGFVQLEHHFECYSYRSNDGSRTIDMQALQNSCVLLVRPFERGYGGTYTGQGQYAQWNPHKYDSNLWQIRRGVPRRVMYAGSGVPLFHFDLVSMENYCKDRPTLVGPDGTSFQGEEFLTHYYRYFFSMIFYSEEGCEYVGDIPESFEWDFSHLMNSYSYVRFWLEQMIIAGIVRIKDHAIDISNEVNEIIVAGRYVTNPEGEQEIIIADSVNVEVGGLSGYIDLINFFGVSAGAQNATTPKIIKDKLLNTEGLYNYPAPTYDPENDDENTPSIQMRTFLPRRAHLPSAQLRTGLTAWGCTGGDNGGSVSGATHAGISCADYVILSVDVPGPLNASEPEDPYSNLNAIRVMSGLAGTFVLDGTGKLSVFGGIPVGGDAGCTEEGNVFSMYPGGIACIPYYLNAATLFSTNSNGEVINQNPLFIPDGRVVDMTVTSPNFVSTLVEFERGGSGLLCATSETDPEGSENSSFESGENTPEYQRFNCNGTNIGLFPSGPVCLANEPFYVVPGPAGTSIIGPRVRGTVGPNGEVIQPPLRNLTFRIKSWGSRSRELATFSLAFEDARDYNLDRGFDPFINPNNLRYPGTNTWYIWQKIGSGLQHFGALDDYGGLFITPNSSNEDGQATKGIPLAYDDPYNTQYRGFEALFNYFNHIPRPGYVKEEEWNQDFYNSVTSQTSLYRSTICACPSSDPNCHPPPAPGGFADPITCRGFSVTIPSGDSCIQPTPPVYDITCALMGSYVQYAGVLQANFATSQPFYTDLTAGHFNTMLLTNENKIELYGKYYRIDANGTKIGPIVSTTDTNGNPIEFIQGITCFVPEIVENLKGSWNVTYGCPIFCGGITHSPIIEATYTPPSENSQIKILRSSADYSLCATQGNNIYIWGDASMVPGMYNADTYTAGTTAATVLQLPGADTGSIVIKNIATGIHAFYVYYTVTFFGTSAVSNRVYSYTRFGKEDYGTSIPLSLQGKEITDISAGYGFAVAIFSEGLEAKKWDYQSFAPDHQKYQYKNFNNIPDYFKRDAFFHAIPGGWDYSKWLYGANCCLSITNPDHPCLQSDTCAALAYNIYQDPENNNNFNINLSYSGHPEYFWMRKDFRRLTTQALDIIKDPQDDDINCDVGPGGTEAAAGSVLNVGLNYGFCYKEVGNVWGEGRPSPGKLATPTQIPITPACWRGNDYNCFPEREYYYRGMAVDELGSILAVDVPFIPTTAYRATKDIFQQMTVRYHSSPDSGTDFRCAEHEVSSISYFKYCERHYYLGYDPEKDTWEIYENPDLLKNTLTNKITPIEYLPGFTGATFSEPNTLCGWGGGYSGCSGYVSLQEYPRVGPNYNREDWVLHPVYIPSDPTIVNSIQGNLCFQEVPDPDCVPCTISSPLGGIGSFIILKYGGPGTFVFRPPCRRGSSIPKTNIFTMWNRFAYFNIVHKTDSPSTILKGTCSYIGLTLDPAVDPEALRIGFLDVLKNPNDTEIARPWMFPSSTKWIPLCWESESIFNNGFCTSVQGTTEGPICFAGADDPNIKDNTIKIVCEDGLRKGFFTVPVTCSLINCCGE